MRSRLGLVAWIPCAAFAAGCLAIDDFDDVRASKGAGGGGATASASTASLSTSDSTGASASGPICGDGTKNGADACDGTDFGGATCATVTGHPDAGGSLSCTPACAIDGAACVFCGDGACNNNEGCGPGTQNCEADCGVCPGCNNGQIDAGEQCDGANLNGATCASATGHAEAQGTLKCTGGCGFDVSECQFCGDGARNNGEQCEGTDLGGATCASLSGHFEAEGSVGCSPSCTYTTACNMCGVGGPSCYARCCNYFDLPGTTCSSAQACATWGNAQCGGSGGVSSVNFANGQYQAPVPTYCKVKCNSFSTWHNVGNAEGFNIPSCGAGDATTYCNMGHGGFDGHSVKSSNCP
ncbi:MAG: hypothetical protein U0414_04165 [Polyangiaceae bacterium]